MTADPIFKPNRDQRRQVAGRPCCSCNEEMLSADVLGVRTEEAVLWMHGYCIKQLLENAAPEETE